MQVLINKKNLNRIFRKNAQSIQNKINYIQMPSEPISTFKSNRCTSISLLNTGRKPENKNNQSGQIISFETLTRFYVPDKFKQLAKPKQRNINLECRRLSNLTDKTLNKTQFLLDQIIKKPQLPNSARLLAHKRRFSSLNNTISTFNNKNQSKVKKNKIPSFHSNQQLSLQHQQFQRKHKSLLKNYDFETEQMKFLTKNQISSNKLGKLSQGEILQIKQKEESKKEFILALLKTGQRLSNQAVAESDQLRQLYMFMPDIQHKSNVHKIDEIHDFPQIFDAKALQKYKKLLYTINDSQQKYGLYSYEEYDKNLTQKTHFLRNKKKKRNSQLYSCVEQWR